MVYELTDDDCRTNMTWAHVNDTEDLKDFTVIVWPDREPEHVGTLEDLDTFFSGEIYLTG